MDIQEKEEMDYNPMSPYQFEAGAVQQDGWQRPGNQYLLTNFDTWVLNPFWDGVEEMDFNEVYEDGAEESTESAAATVCPVEPDLPDDGLPF